MESLEALQNTTSISVLDPGAASTETLDDLPRIVAVIPAHNEERFIGTVVLEATQYARVVIVVDDGSTDRTARVAERAGAVVVRLPVQGGKGVALNAGFEHSRRFEPDAVVTLDGDAQHDPAEIPMLAAPVLGHIADVVIGSRFLNVTSQIPWWRTVGQRVLTVVTNAASGVKVSDSQTGYRAFSPRALDVLHFESAGLTVESEMQFLLRKRALTVAEVGVHVEYRDGSKRNPVRHGLSVIDGMLHIVARRHPLLMVGGPGVIMAVVGILLGVVGLHLARGGQPIRVWLLTASVLLLLVGLVLGVTATILHSLERFAERVGNQLEEVLGRNSGSQGGRSV
ncbi:MAG: glycosyltransferase family 2 protein [Clostridia bacterium]